MPRQSPQMSPARRHTPRSLPRDVVQRTGPPVEREPPTRTAQPRQSFDVVWYGRSYLTLEHWAKHIAQLHHAKPRPGLYSAKRLTQLKRDFAVTETRIISQLNHLSLLNGQRVQRSAHQSPALGCDCIRFRTSGRSGDLTYCVQGLLVLMLVFTRAKSIDAARASDGHQPCQR